MSKNGASKKENKKNAQKVCDYTNKLFNDNYEVVEI